MDGQSSSLDKMVAATLVFPGSRSSYFPFTYVSPGTEKKTTQHDPFPEAPSIIFRRN